MKGAAGGLPLGVGCTTAPQSPRAAALAMLRRPDGASLQELADALGLPADKVARTVAALGRELPIWEEDCPIGCEEAPCPHSRLHLPPTPGGENG